MAYVWTDKVVLITGAANGIGALIVRMLVEKENVKHITILDVAETAGNALSKELNSKFGEKVFFRKCDATSDEQLFAGFQSVVDRYGYIDVVINNAGVMNDSKNVYKKMIDLNYTTVCTSTIRAMELMSKENGGRGGTVINTASIAALVQHPLLPMYFGTKSAVLQFTSCISMDPYHAKTGVRLFTVCYSATDSELIVDMESKGIQFPFVKSVIGKMIKEFPVQKIESAAGGLIDAYKKAANGSTWLSKNNNPVLDITDRVTKAYEILSEGIME